MKHDIIIRRALPEEAEALTALIRRAKAHWGYDPAWLDAWRDDLTLAPETIARDPVYCAEVAGTLAGVCHLRALSATEVLLADLFVDPPFIGTGVGGRLWHFAVDYARSLGAHELTFEADPNARPFYEHMGAVVVGANISPIIPGRTTPQMRYTLP